MRLKNIVIVVDDVEKSKYFYKDLFGLDVILDGETNVILTQGLVLQDRCVLEQAIAQPIERSTNDTILYFEDTDIEDLAKKLAEYPQKIQILEPFTELPNGKRYIRFYDLDEHLIEVASWQQQDR